MRSNWFFAEFLQ